MVIWLTRDVLLKAGPGGPVVISVSASVVSDGLFWFINSLEVAKVAFISFYDCIMWKQSLQCHGTKEMWEIDFFSLTYITLVSKTEPEPDLEFCLEACKEIAWVKCPAASKIM